MSVTAMSATSYHLENTQTLNLFISNQCWYNIFVFYFRVLPVAFQSSVLTEGGISIALSTDVLSWMDGTYEQLSPLAFQLDTLILTIYKHFLFQKQIITELPLNIKQKLPGVRQGDFRGQDRKTPEGVVGNSKRASWADLIAGLNPNCPPSELGAVQQCFP